MEIIKFKLIRDYKKLKKILMNEKRWSCASYYCDLQKEKTVCLYVLKHLCESDFSYILCRHKEIFGIVGLDIGKKKNYKRYIFNFLLNIYGIFIGKENKAGITKYYYENEYAYRTKPKVDSEITLLMVDKSKRGNGFGQKLINFIEDLSKKYDNKTIGLQTDSSCDYLFYETQGYKKVFEDRFEDDDIFYYIKSL